MKADSRGFTLPEVLVAIAILAGLLAAATLFLRPKDYSSLNQDAERQTGIAAIAQGLHDYQRDNGGWPEGVPTKQTAIASTSGSYNLCKYLVPKYLKGIPLDPALGNQYIGEDNNPIPTTDPCNQSGVKYTTGYTIQQNNDGSLTVAAGSVHYNMLAVTIR